MARNATLAILLILAAGSSVFGQQWARKMFPQSKHDFGSVARGAKAEHEFEFSNIYVEDVHVVGRPLRDVAQIAGADLRGVLLALVHRRAATDAGAQQDQSEGERARSGREAQEHGDNPPPPPSPAKDNRPP